MITNGSISKLGPGPAAYDHLRALKYTVTSNAKVGPVIRKPHELADKVKKNLNVSSSEDLLKLKLQAMPGPGQYNHEESY